MKFSDFPSFYLEQGSELGFFCSQISSIYLSYLFIFIQMSSQSSVGLEDVFYLVVSPPQCCALNRAP